jgi:hypothetical protein
MKRTTCICFILALLLPALKRGQAETIFPARDLTENGDPISWVGSRTVFVGHYTWPDRMPLGVYNDGARLVNRADLSIAGCDLAADTCTTDTPMLFGGLPDGTEVKLVTTGTLPGGLVAWNTDHAKAYYVRDWSGNSFKLSAAPGGPAIHLDANIRAEGKHGMSFAGYSHVMTLLAAKAVKIECDPDTDICTSERPHLFHEGAAVYVNSTGQLPDGLYGFGGGKNYAYCLTYISPTTFKLRVTQSGFDANCSAPSPTADIKSKGKGTHYLFGFYLPAKAEPEARNEQVFVHSMSGYPPGTVLSWRAMQKVTMPTPTNNGYGQFEPGGFFSVTMFAKIPAITPMGDYRITVKTSESRSAELNPNSFQYTVKAISLPVTSLAAPKEFPKIPGLKTWEQVMTSNNNGGGSALSMYPRCANRKDPQAPMGWADAKGVVTLSNTGDPYPVSYNPGSDARVWFYNDETFFRIAQYTGDPSWANCGVFIAAAMREKFQKFGPAAMPAYFYFPWTLVGGFRFTKDPSYRDTVISIADGGTGARGSVSDFAMRENAFAFEGRLAKRDVTGQEDYDLPYYADAALGQLYVNATGSPDRIFNEPFMLGLAMRPLIRWYMISHDEHIPVVIKLTLDKLWDNWYDHRAHHFYYNPEPAGERCAIGCQKWTSAKLNNLVSPGYAWYWRLTGDEAERERGDDLFSHVYDEGYPYSAKEWSTGYYWSWDFVDWRQGKKPAN